MIQWYTIDGIPECRTPECDSSGMWSTIHEPSGRVLRSYSWGRLVYKALCSKIEYRRAPCGEGPNAQCKP